VYDIEIDGGSVWLGGDFDSVNGTARNNAAAVSDANSDGVTTAWNPNVDDVVEDMAIDNANNRMFLTGRFGTVGGSTRTGIAAVSQMGTGALDSWAPAAGVWGYAVGATTSSAFFGGAGAVTGGAARRNLAAINLQTGTVVTGFSADTNDTVLTIKVAFGRVYIGGHFTTVKGTPRLRAAAIDPATSQVTAWNPAAGAGVLDIETDADTVYIGGQFSSVAAVAHSGIAATDPTTGAVAAWNPDISAGSVTTLRLAGTRLYAGGTFTDVDGTSADGVAAFDTANNHALIPTFIPDLSSPATPITMGLAASSSAVWVGGSHTAVGDVLSANLQGIDPADGGPLDGWRTFGSDSMINDLQLIDGNLIAVGDFDNYDEVPRVGIVAIDPATGQPRDWRPHTAVNLAGDEAAAWGKGIVVGGDFTRGSTPAARNLLAYPGVATLLTAPKVSGTTKVGRTVTCSTGSWTGRPSLTVNWYSGTRRVAGGRKYRLRASDAGKSIRCRERAANAAGAALAYSAKRSVT
jgi:trimeric autotransporter adhesin